MSDSDALEIKVIGDAAKRALPNVDREAEREFDRIMAKKYAEEDEAIGVFVGQDLYNRIESLCEQEDLKQDELIAKALNELESD